MLNLYKNYIKINNLKIFKNNIIINYFNDFPSSTREWNNSIYTFNVNNINLIPETTKLAINLIKNYFNLYNKNLESKIRKFSLLRRFKKLSSNKIYISNGIFKHTNNKVIITLYVYNRQTINYTYFIERRFNNFITNKLINILLLLKTKVNNYNQKVENNILILKELLNNNDKKYLDLYINTYKKYYNTKIYKKILKKVFVRYKKYFLYKQLLFINKSKFNYNYLTYLTSILKKVYNKNIEFDIVNLKYFYLNSDILTESILLKVRRDRRKLTRKLKYLIIKSKIKNINKFLTKKFIEKNTKNTIKNLDPISKIIIINKNKYKNVKKTVLNTIKYKKVSGIRLEASGRLTRRYTASKTISKLGYKGNLINIDSSYLGIPSVYLRGNLRPNLQYTKLNSKTRIGSFGLKGWVSSY